MNINKILKYIIIAGVFSIPFIPLVISGTLFFPFITGKNFAFRIIVEIIFASWILLALRDPEYRPKTSLILWGSLAFLGIIAFADILSPNPGKSLWSNFERMEGLVTHIHLVAFLIVTAAILQTQKLWSWFFHVNFGVSFFMVLYSILQLTGELVINQGGVRVDGTFGNAIYFAVYLLFNSFLLLYVAFSNRSKTQEILWSFIGGFSGFLFFYLSRLGADGAKIQKVGGILCLLSIFAIIGASYLLWKNQISRGKKKFISLYVKNILYSALIVAQMAVLFFTATRGAILGTITGVFCIAVLFSIFEKESKHLRRISIAILALFFLLGGLFFSARNTDFVRGNSVLSRFSSLLNSDLKTFLERGEGKSRYLNGKAAIMGFKEKPILGWGQESFNYVFNKYYDPRMYDQEPWFDRAHNVIFDWLIAGGILGLLSYLSLFVFAFYYLWKGKKKEDHSISFRERTVLSGLLIAYFLQNFTVFDNITSYILFFIVLAYIHFVYGSSLSLNEKKRQKSEKFPLDKIVAPLVIVGLFFSLYFVNIKGILAAKTLSKAISYQGVNPVTSFEYFQKALSYSTFGQSEIREFILQASERLTSSNIDQKIKDAYFNLAKKELQDQLKETPEDLRYLYFIGILLNRNKNFIDGIAYLEKAVEISPKKQAIIVELGTAYINIGNYEKGLATFKSAYESNPSIEDIKILYAIALVYAGKEEQARELLGPKYDSLLAADNRFINAFVGKKDYATAIKLLRQRIEKDPNNLQYHLVLADTYARANENFNAILELQTAIKIDPSFKQQGEAYIKQIQEGKIK